MASARDDVCASPRKEKERNRKKKNVQRMVFRLSLIKVRLCAASKLNPLENL